MLLSFGITKALYLSSPFVWRTTFSFYGSEPLYAGIGSKNGNPRKSREKNEWKGWHFFPFLFVAFFERKKEKKVKSVCKNLHQQKARCPNICGRFPVGYRIPELVFVNVQNCLQKGKTNKCHTPFHDICFSLLFSLFVFISSEKIYGFSTLRKRIQRITNGRVEGNSGTDV